MANAPSSTGWHVVSGTAGSSFTNTSSRFTRFTAGQKLWLNFFYQATRNTGTGTLTITANVNWYNSSGTLVSTTTGTTINIGATVGWTYTAGDAHVAPVGAVSGELVLTITPSLNPLQHDVYVASIRFAATQIAATAGAIIGPGGNVTGAVDSFGRAIIDFAQSHFNNNQDNIGDGLTYVRLPAATTTGTGATRRPLINFTDAHTGNNLDNIGDGTTYARLPSANSTGTGTSRRALIDFTQSHLNKSLANVDSTANTKLTGIQTGATANNPRGTWVSGTAYAVNDMVYYNGAMYVCTTGVSGTTAPSADTGHWQKYGPASLDDVPDGATYGRINAANIIGGAHSWGAINSRPTELTDGRVSAGLTSAGDINRNVPSTIRINSGIMGHATGATFTGDTNATYGATWGGTLTGSNQPIDNAGRVLDTRSVDSLPSVYYAKSLGEYHEFKTSTFSSTISGNTGFGHLITVVQWSDSSGGPIKQMLTDSVGAVFQRISTGTSTWGSWFRNYNGAYRPRLGGDILDSSGTSLGDTDVKNTAISLSSAGALSGAGGGSIAYDSLPDGSTYAKALASRLSSGKPLIDFSEAIHLNKSLANVDATQNTKLTGIAAGATVNNVTYSASAPSGGVNGDIWVYTGVSPNVTYVKVAGVWQVGANYSTNTNQLTDGANLGGTAAWTGVSSRPANLSALAGSEGIQNTLISLSSAGALSGAGGGSIAYDSLPDGSTYAKALASRLSSGKPLIDFNESIHINKSLASVDSTANTKLGGIAAGATVGATWGTNLSSTPANLSAIGGTEALLNSTNGNELLDDTFDANYWNLSVGSGNSIGRLTRNNTSGFAFGYAPWVFNWDVPSNTATASEINTAARPFPVEAGKVYNFGVWAQKNGAAVATSSFTYGVRWFDSSNATISTNTSTVVANSITASVSPAMFRASVQAPSNAVTGIFVLSVQNSAATTGFTFRFERPFINKVESTGLTYSGSGIRVGDQRNLPAISAMNLSYKVTKTSDGTTTSLISYSSVYNTTSDNNTVSIVAVTVLIGGVSVSYSAMTSATFTTAVNVNATVHLYVDDPSYAGGTPSGGLKTVLDVASNTIFQADGRVYLGSITFLTSSGGTSGGSGGSGGGGGCPTEDMLILLANGSEKPAGEIQVGDMVHTQHEHTMEWGDYPVTAVNVMLADTCERDGWPTVSPNHLFHDGDDWFEAGTHASPAGSQRVMKITVGDAHTYMLRHPSSPDWRLSHNVKPIG